MKLSVRSSIRSSIKSPRKITRLAALITLCLVVALTVGVLSAPSTISVEAQESDFAASLLPLAGLVQFQARGSSEWVTVTENQLVRAGDQIRTGSNGYARFSTITGIDIEIYPTSYVQVARMATREDAGQEFMLYQYVGQVFASVGSTRPQDSIQVIMPTAGAAVRGTQFWVFVHPRFRAAVVSQDDEVEVRSSETDEVAVATPENLVYIDFNAEEPFPAVCTEQFLVDNTDSTLVTVPLNDPEERLEAVRSFLADFLQANVNPVVRGFLRDYLGLPSVELDDLTDEEEGVALQEIFDAINELEVDEVDLFELLDAYRSYWASTYRGTLLVNPVAPATCGNLVQDDGEDEAICPDDFSTDEFCGNGLCETDRRDNIYESVVNCEIDCTGGDLAVACTQLSSRLNSAGTAGGPGFPESPQSPVG
jgi:hypothetical protein